MSASQENDGKKNVYINCSEVSSYINQNKWDYVTPFIRLWKRVDYINYMACENKNMLSDDEPTVELDKINELKETLGNDFIQETITTTTNKSDMDKNIQLSLKKIDTLDVSDDKKAELKVNVESLINTSFGTNNEFGALDLYESLSKLKLNKEQIYTTKAICETEKYNWLIGGKVDGICESRVVEVKTRTKCFFKDVRDYENTQMQLYMYIYDRKITDLVEYLPQSRMKIKITTVKKNKKQFDTIIENIKTFINYFEEFIGYSLEKKYEFYKMDLYDKKDFLNKLYLNKMMY
jgi:hypothetical protein